MEINLKTLITEDVTNTHIIYIVEQIYDRVKHELYVLKEADFHSDKLHYVISCKYAE